MREAGGSEAKQDVAERARHDGDSGTACYGKAKTGKPVSGRPGAYTSSTSSAHFARDTQIRIDLFAMRSSSLST